MRHTPLAPEAYASEVSTPLAYTSGRFRSASPGGASRRMPFTPFRTLVWLYNIGWGSLVYTVEKVCDGSGEDPTCSRSVSGNSITDHLEYFGIELQAETWDSCRIVLDHDMSSYSSTDLSGNIVLSRTPIASVLELNTQKRKGGISVL